MSTELAWAAGFLDGEGWFGLSRGVDQARDNQVDIRPLIRLQKALGGLGIIGGPIIKPNPNASPIWYYRVRRNGETERVLKLLWPYLSEPKREQALRAAWAMLGHRRLRPHGNAIYKQPDTYFPTERPPLPTHAKGPSRREFCPRGHSMADAYDTRGQRSCRTCVKARQRRYSAAARLGGGS